MNDKRLTTTAQNIDRGGSDRNILVVEDFLSPQEVDEILFTIAAGEWTPGSPAKQIDPSKLVHQIDIEPIVSLIESIASYEFGVNAQRYDGNGLFNKWTVGDSLQMHVDCGVSLDTGIVPVADFVNSTENFPPPAILYSSVLFFNDDYEGGELRFPKQDYYEKPKPGTLIIFPATCLYPNETKKVLAGNRYTYTLHLSDATIADVFAQLIEIAQSKQQPTQ